MRVSTSLRFADQPFDSKATRATGDGLVVEGTITADAIDTQRWLDRLPLAAADAAAVTRK